ncbi:hypothetical protein BC332_34563 [Capsicum chinense]|nr:hypothetical protein BC332_34563 [Capsicum chinense]
MEQKFSELRAVFKALCVLSCRGHPWFYFLKVRVGVTISQRMSERKQGETKKQRMSEAQKTHLITYMVDHSYFAKHGVDPGPNGSDAGAKRWQKLTNELNAIGAATKDASGWKQVRIM